MSNIDQKKRVLIKKEAQLQRNSNKSSYYRTFEDSPNFYKNIGAIASSGKVVNDIETDFPKAKKFFPITNIQIINGSNVDVTFHPNQRTNGFLIASGTSTILDRKSLGGGFRSWRFENKSTVTAVADEELEVNFWREGIVQEEAFRQLHKAFYKFIYGRRL